MKIQRIYSLLIFLSALLFLTPATVLAGAESGIYIGFGLTDSTVKASNVDTTTPTFVFNESTTGQKLIAGYNIGFIPFVDIAVEGSYLDFGNASGFLPGNVPINFDISGVVVFGLVGLNFGPLSVFLKSGVFDWDYDSSLGDGNGSNSAYGIGAKFQFGSYAVRIEYEDFDVGIFEELTQVSTSFVYTF